MADETKRKAYVDIRDLVGIVGLALVCAGAWQIYPPSTYIVAGVTFMAIAVMGARR